MLVGGIVDPAGSGSSSAGPTPTDPGTNSPAEPGAIPPPDTGTPSPTGSAHASVVRPTGRGPVEDSHPRLPQSCRHPAVPATRAAHPRTDAARTMTRPPWFVPPSDRPPRDLSEF